MTHPGRFKTVVEYPANDAFKPFVDLPGAAAWDDLHHCRCGRDVGAARRVSRRDNC
jgi:hypothetical protein